ncbi:hypothetical protein Tco_0684085, partial [Tanacetum coccineum]
MTFINANVLSNFVSLQCLSSLLNALLQNTMAEQNVPAQPPTRTDEQIVPRSQWLTIGKSNLLFNAQKIQKNPIFQISVDILSNTNFFQAFTASANVPAIYLQQFFQTNVDHAELIWEEFTQGIQTFFSHKASHKASLKNPDSSEMDILSNTNFFQAFTASANVPAIYLQHADLLRKALANYSVNPTHTIELPPSGTRWIGFCNEAGIAVDILSNTNFFRAFTASASVLAIYMQQFWNTMKYDEKTGVYSCQVDEQWFYLSADLLRKALAITPIIPAQPFELPPSGNTVIDFILGNLKFVPKGESAEVFGMAIPDPLITEAIQQSSYYPKYLEMVAENTTKTPKESASVQPATKHATPKKPKSTTPCPQEEGDDPDLELAKKMSLEAHQEKGEGEGDDADMERAIKLSLDPAFLPQGRAPVGGVTIRDPVSETTPKLPEVVGKGKAIVTEEQVAHSLIDLSKKKRTTDQFILVRRDQTPHDSTTGPSSQPEDDTSEKV